jgi:hypothetical protein
LSRTSVRLHFDGSVVVGGVAMLKHFDEGIGDHVQMSEDIEIVTGRGVGFEVFVEFVAFSRADSAHWAVIEHACDC